MIDNEQVLSTDLLSLIIMATISICKLDHMSWLLACRDLGGWTPSAWPSQFRDGSDDTVTTRKDIAKFGMNP